MSHTCLKHNDRAYTPHRDECAECVINDCDRAGFGYAERVHKKQERLTRALHAALRGEHQIDRLVGQGPVHITPLAMRIYVLMSWLDRNTMVVQKMMFTIDRIHSDLWTFCGNWPGNAHIEHALRILEKAGLVRQFDPGFWEFV